MVRLWKQMLAVKIHLEKLIVTISIIKLFSLFSQSIRSFCLKNCIFFWRALVFGKFTKQAKSAVIPRYEKCFILRLISSHPGVKDFFYSARNQQSSWNMRNIREFFILPLDQQNHLEMWENLFCQNIIFFRLGAGNWPR